MNLFQQYNLLLLCFWMDQRTVSIGHRLLGEVNSIDLCTIEDDIDRAFARWLSWWSRKESCLFCEIHLAICQESSGESASNWLRSNRWKIWAHELCIQYYQSLLSTSSLATDLGPRCHLHLSLDLKHGHGWNLKRCCIIFRLEDIHQNSVPT